MQLFQDFLDRSKQLNLAPKKSHLNFHIPTRQYKFVYFGIILPNLPAPLHYFNFIGLMGAAHAPMLRNESAIHSTAIDTATILCSSSPHMVGQLHSYAMQRDCHFSKSLWQFSNHEQILGNLPNFQIQRDDDELSCQLSVQTTTQVSYFNKMRLGLGEHWSTRCFFEGRIAYKEQIFPIAQHGVFEFARAIQFPYLPLAFFTYQIIQLNNGDQVLMAQTRDHFNRIVQSRIYLKYANVERTELFDEQVQFKVHRVYPKVVTPNGQAMYLPREFEWNYQNKTGDIIQIQAQSRGDFKFGLAAGYVGSFKYQIKINAREEYGEAGYCEYVDCRALKWQEKNQDEKILDDLINTVPFMLKK